MCTTVTLGQITACGGSSCREQHFLHSHDGHISLRFHRPVSSQWTRIPTVFPCRLPAATVTAGANITSLVVDPNGGFTVSVG